MSLVRGRFLHSGYSLQVYSRTELENQLGHLEAITDLWERTLAFALCLFAAFTAWGQDGIPKAAWKRPLGLPLENPGVTRTPGDIDDGYWQGTPVGGFGAGTFSRSCRGDFARWHIKAAVHMCMPISLQYSSSRRTRLKELPRC